MANKYFVDRIYSTQGKTSNAQNKLQSKRSRDNNYFLISLFASVYEDIINGREPAFAEGTILAKYSKYGLIHDVNDPDTGKNRLGFDTRNLSEKVRAFMNLIDKPENQTLFKDSFFAKNVIRRLLEVEWGDSHGIDVLQENLTRYRKDENAPVGLDFVYLIDSVVQKNPITGKYQLVQEPNDIEKGQIDNAVGQFVNQLGGKEIEDENE